MEISYLGHSCFEIKDRRSQSGLVTVVIDPFDPKMMGLPFKKQISADLVLVSHDHSDHNFTSAISGQPYVVSGPGEYEVKEVKIFGVSSFHDEKEGLERGRNTIYSFEIDGVRLCHLGDLGTSLTDTQLEQIGKVDILFIPVGGTYTIDPKKAVEVATALEPLIVIPMHYKVPGLPAQAGMKAFETLHGVEDFVREFGKTQKNETVLKITKDKLPLELEVVVLEIQK